MKIKPGQQKKNLVIKTKKKVIKTAGRKKPKIAKMPHSFPKKKKRRSYNYIRRYCLEMSLGNLDRFAYRLQKEFGLNTLDCGSGWVEEGASVYEEFLEGGWNEDPRNEDDLSSTGLEYDRDCPDKTKITLVFSSKAKRVAAKPLIEALLLSYGFIPTMFRITEYNDHRRIDNHDYRWY